MCCPTTENCGYDFGADAYYCCAAATLPGLAHCPVALQYDLTHRIRHAASQGAHQSIGWETTSPLSADLSCSKRATNGHQSAQDDPCACLRRQSSCPGWQVGVCQRSLCCAGSQPAVPAARSSACCLAGPTGTESCNGICCGKDDYCYLSDSDGSWACECALVKPRSAFPLSSSQHVRVCSLVLRTRRTVSQGSEWLPSLPNVPVHRPQWSSCGPLTYGLQP